MEFEVEALMSGWDGYGLYSRSIEAESFEAACSKIDKIYKTEEAPLDEESWCILVRLDGELIATKTPLGWSRAQ